MKRTISSPPADLDDLKALRINILRNFPIQASDGNIFQFSRDDEETIEGALLGLADNPAITLNWRLLDDGDTVVVDLPILSSYLDELKRLRSRRGLVVDAEYMQLKVNGCTQRQLHDWEKKYKRGYVPELSEASVLAE